MSNNTAAVELVSKPSIKLAPLSMLVGGAVALVALFALPWVDDISLWKFMALGGHGAQVAWVIIGPQVAAIAIGALSLKSSRRWLTAPAALLSLAATFLCAVAKHGQAGAKVAAIGGGIALLSAIVMTVRPVRA